MAFKSKRAISGPAPRQWVGMTEVRAHLGGVTQQTISSYIKAGMPAHQIVKGGRYLFDLVEVDEWICSRWSQPAAGETA